MYTLDTGMEVEVDTGTNSNSPGRGRSAKTPATTDSKSPAAKPLSLLFTTLLDHCSSRGTLSLALRTPTISAPLFSAFR